MRLVIDLQGAQSIANRGRGICRYSLALATEMTRHANGHEVVIALNDAFADTVQPLRAAFEDLLPKEQVTVWSAPGPVAEKEPGNGWRRQAGEILRESFIAGLRPDMVHVSSLFEGYADDALTSVGRLADGQMTAATLYDLIPLVHRDTYLADPVQDAWYQGKLGSLRRAGLWLAISDSSRREGIEFLDLPAERVVSIQAAADEMFRPTPIDDEQAAALRRRYGIGTRFVLCTGGIDPRKNLERLIAAFGLLPGPVRAGCHLVIVCSVSGTDAAKLQRHARDRGLAAGELVLAGHVPDADLLALYNLCTTYCCPSWHEGFGLPVLEAMQCGAPAIGSNCSSIPEVIGRADALFDPYDERDIAARLHRVLTDPDFRSGLARHGLAQARTFSWRATARRAWDALESHHRAARERPAVFVPDGRRRRLAYLSPLPPARSGIADYSAELLPELARHYDIDVIVDQEHVADPWILANCPVRDVAWFKANHSLFDRTLYHFGNSALHGYLFDLIERCPGAVVLHDVFLSGVTLHMEAQKRDGRFTRALYDSHGYAAVQERSMAADAWDLA